MTPLWTEQINRSDLFDGDYGKSNKEQFTECSLWPVIAKIVRFQNEVDGPLIFLQWSIWRALKNQKLRVQTMN